MKLDRWRSTSPLLRELSDDHVAFLAEHSDEVTVGAGEKLFTISAPANRFFLVTDGSLALRITAAGRAPMTIQTFGEGSMVGLSWRLPPYRWQWTAAAIEPATVAAFDANAVLARCEIDGDLNLALLETVARASANRLQNVRMQLLDIYGGRQE